MNIRRTATILGVTAFGAVTLLGAGTANAAPPATDWGVNTDGWHVDILNKSNTPLPTFVTSPFSNVDSRTGNLDTGHESHVRGIKSKVAAGPADIDFEYRKSRGAFVPGIAVQVQSFGLRIPDATCLVTFSTDLECHVESVSKTDPIKVVIYNK